MPSQYFTNPPPSTSFTKISFPAPNVLLVTLSRPKSLNCINSAGNVELHELFTWLDAEPSLRVGIVTGEGRAFCAGADLKEWDSANTSHEVHGFPSSGFGGLSMRVGKKPVIAAVNGLCFGGGFEMIVNADMVIAAPAAKFGLPEVKRGVVAVAGALPRLVRTVGRPRAMEMALLGRAYGAEEMRNWGVVNMVAEAVVEEAVKWAVELAGNSPDSVTTSKKGVELGWMGQGAVEGSIRLMTDGWPKMNGGENMMEGVKAFVEKRAPRWVDSKL